MFTNGYLLDEKFIEKLPKLGIKTVQITVDGTKEIHDSRRFLLGGKPTFSKIKENIENLVKANNQQLKIILRINLDFQNINSFEPLIEEFKNMSGKIRITFVKTCSGLGAGENYPGCFDVKSYKKISANFRELLYTNKFGIRKLPMQVNCACYAETANSFAVDPFGNVYKCIAGISLQKDKLGTLTTAGDIKYNQVELEKWNSYNILEDVECLNCKYLPICMGGCTLSRFEESRRTNPDKKKNCFYETGGPSLEERVIQYYQEHSKDSSNVKFA
ncbi:MAG: SPASM domain-containing protein [Proteobacteria bacterium]|nr:SPASM domain-containing protein [Pseudomonadota bacterium]